MADQFDVGTVSPDLRRAITAPPSGGDLSDLTSQLKERITKDTAGQEEVRAATMKTLQNLQKSRQEEKGKEQALEAENPFTKMSPDDWKRMFEPPAPKYSNPYQGFGSLAAQLATFASAFTRRPLINALNAQTAVINAYKQNDLEGANREFETWKANKDLAIQMLNWQYQQYKTQLDRLHSDSKDERDDARAELTILAASHGDPVMQNLVSLGNFEVAEKNATMNYSVRAQELEKTAAELEVLKPKVDVAKLQQMKGALPPNDPRRAEIDQKIADYSTGGQGRLSPEAISQIADQYIAGDKSALQGLGWGAVGSANRAAVRDELANRGVSGSDIAASIAEFSGTQAGERTLGQRTANLGMALFEAKQFVPLGVAASEKVDRTDFPNLNSVLLAAERGTGGEDVVRLAVATNAISNAYAMVAARGGQSTDAARAQAREILSNAYSKGQYRTATDQMMKEIEAAQAAPTAVRQEFRGAITDKKGTEAPTAEPKILRFDAQGNPMQ